MAKKQPGRGKPQAGPPNRLMPEAEKPAPEQDTAPLVHLNWNWERPTSAKEPRDIYAKPESYGEPHTRLVEEVPASVRRMLRPQPAPLADAEWTLRDGRGISEVLADLRHGEWPVRAAALHSLCRLLDEAVAVRPTILPVLAEMLASSDLDQLLSAATILQKLGPVAAPLVPVAIQVFDSDDEFVRLNVFDPLATALGRMGPAAREAGPTLFRIYKGDNYQPNQLAAQLALLRIHGLSEDDKRLYEILGYSKNYQSFVNELNRRGHLAESKDIPPPERGQIMPADALKSLAASLPGEYEWRAPALAKANHEYRQELAAQLTPALNARVQAMPQGTLDQKKAICDFVAAELEPLGLAVQCPKTGLPAKLKGVAGNWPGVGRFLFEVYIDGKRKQPAASDTLPTLTLIDATPPKERETVIPSSEQPEGSWQEKVGPKASRSGRKLS